ncbi:TlpA family protein disulfide reductase [Pedobacter ginsengisoli]|uniref:TlpA family protein disulfide reductase n=1 Tax=Pedobacter ginsengisoli TaxID=363852 RepID=UPI002550D002|nr:TlpA disulfide reductase family protein [Pedobacter ginsengisoli]
MKLLRLTLIMSLLPIVLLAQTDSTTLTKVGDKLPDFSFDLEKGKTVKIGDYKGKLILINFFATWCGPCNMELPLVQKQIWEKYKDHQKFAFFVFGREEGWEILDPFKQKKGFSFPMIPDMNREIFKKFATQSIPRNVIADEQGNIIYQSIGFSEKEFKEMVDFIDLRMKALSK